MSIIVGWEDGAYWWRPACETDRLENTIECPASTVELWEAMGTCSRCWNCTRWRYESTAAWRACHEPSCSTLRCTSRRQPTGASDCTRTSSRWDGNKRTAWFACRIFLGLNGFRLKVRHQEAERFVRSIAEGRFRSGWETIRAWIVQYAEAVDE